MTAAYGPWAETVLDSLATAIISLTHPYGTNRAEQVVASNVTVIAAGINHSLFLKSDGSLWAMGANWGGQLGDGTYAKTNRPEQIVASGVTTIAARDHSLFLKNDGSLWVMGNNQYGQLGDGTTNNSNLPKQIVASGVTAIAAGDSPALPQPLQRLLRAALEAWAEHSSKTPEQHQY